MMMDERPESDNDDGDPTDAGTKSIDDEKAGTIQRSGSGDTRRSLDGSGNTR